MNNINIFNKKNLESLLRKNWTSFINSQKLAIFILQQMQDTKFETVKSESVNQTGKYTVSNLEFTTDGLLLWVEFHLPYQNGMCTGTCEMHINPEGEIQSKQIIGQYFPVN